VNDGVVAGCYLVTLREAQVLGDVGNLCEVNVSCRMFAIAYQLPVTVSTVCVQYLF